MHIYLHPRRRCRRPARGARPAAVRRAPREAS